MKNLIVKKSKIHGKGVFANKDFKKGEIVIKWQPKILKKSDVVKLTKKQKTYVHISYGKPLLMSYPEKFVNHSDRPNTKAKGHSDVAIRNITKGEEITTNYGKKYSKF